MALGCSCALPSKGSAVPQPPPRVIRQALLLRAVGVITHPSLVLLELASMLVCGDSSVGLPPELTVSNPFVVVFPDEVLTHRTNCFSHFGISPTSPLRPEPPRVNYRQITQQNIHPHLPTFLLYFCQGRPLPRPSVLFRPNVRPHCLNFPGVQAENPLYVMETQPNTFWAYLLRAHRKYFSSVEVTCRISPCTFSREQRDRYSGENSTIYT